MVEMRQRIDRGEEAREIAETIQVKSEFDVPRSEVLTLLGHV